ncbi:hypothetical protein [Paraburkholderia sp. C35]|uniref:hypothetical protein n=1 Tax=Paraburkholderia sp. C35 TaxID=2126993 RepID=UPI000D685BCA|nr:hypothetical protein [Paraburkholderia sp. C35]
MNPLHTRPVAGTSGADAATQAQRGTTEPAQQHTRARFATSLRNNVRFAHAHHAHLQGQARSANARRLAKALAKKRQGKAATARFAPTRRPATTRTGTGAPGARNADRQRNAPLRVTRDGGNGGSRGGGQQQDQQQQQKQQQRQHGNHDDLSMLDGTHGKHRAAGAMPEFATHALTLSGTARRDALASAWCDVLLQPGRPLHDAVAQLRVLRQREGVLPLTSLAQVRQSLMDATARAANTRQQAGGEARPADSVHHVFAPLLALIAGSPLLPARERRATGACAALDGLARMRSMRKAQIAEPSASVSPSTLRAD